MTADDVQPWQVVEIQRLVPVAVFAAALGAAGLGATSDAAFGVLGVLLGYAAATGLERLWGERTRPQNTPMWWLLGIAWVIVFVMLLAQVYAPGSFFLVLAASVLALGVGLVLRHDLGVAPTLILAGVVWVALFQPERLEGGIDGVSGRGPFLQDDHGVWIAVSMLLGILAATLEHERLLRRDGAGTPLPWTVLRMAFVSLWTVVVLTLREDVQWGRVFTFLGADLRGQSGQMLLVGILMAALVVAAYAFRPRKKKDGGPT